MNTPETTPFPKFVVVNVAYLHSFDAIHEAEPIRFGLRGSDLFGSDAIGTPGLQHPDNCLQALEVIFRQLNHVDGTELISQPEFRQGRNFLRSMSVGDVVTFRSIGGWRKDYVCEGIGWTEVSREDADWLLKNISPRDFWGTFAKTVELRAKI